MINIEKNENFKGFFNVFAFGRLVEQVKGRVRAVSLARKLARENSLEHFITHNNNIMEVK
tara:strand:+ start:2216 stop:2395 length:180 start_codon:yes stop_codon:yes gene_type:complete